MTGCTTCGGFGMHHDPISHGTEVAPPCCCNDHPHSYYSRHVGADHWRECVHCGDQTEPDGWSYIRQCPTDDCAGCDSCEDQP